ncbi:MAG: DNA-binding response regulator [Spirochaetaceae bacterium]|nr:MAG: DNA-binding response regulator [Spirochaetaceae bacterium]
MRVAVVDDDGLIRDGLGAILETHDDIEFVGAAGDGETGVELCRRANPDVVLMDVRMPGVDGVAATARIRAEQPQIKVIILTTFDDADYIRGAIDAGAEGYILKSSAADAIVESVRAVHRGTTVLQTEIARRLAGVRRDSAGSEGGASGHGTPSIDALGLAPREAEILTLIAEGLSNKEIAGRLNLSDGTVRNYVSEMLVKLDVRDRTQLAILYYRSL